MSITETTPARIVVEGRARQLCEGVVRVWPTGYDGDASLTFDVTAEGVTYETVPEPWDFRAGDIVAGDWPYRRDVDGIWRGNVGGTAIRWTDAEVADALADEHTEMELLRYQADPARVLGRSS